MLNLWCFISDKDQKSGAQDSTQNGNESDGSHSADEAMSTDDKSESGANPFPLFEYVFSYNFVVKRLFPFKNLIVEKANYSNNSGCYRSDMICFCICNRTSILIFTGKCFSI